MKLSITIYETPLFLAVEKGNVKIVQLLLNHPKIDPNIKHKII